MYVPVGQPLEYSHVLNQTNNWYGAPPPTHIRTEHQNFFGIDEGLGPVAISLKREKVSDGLPEFYGTPATVGPTGMPKNQYRIILRTSKVWCVRVSWGGGGNGCGHGTPPAL